MKSGDSVLGGTARPIAATGREEKRRTLPSPKDFVARLYPRLGVYYVSGTLTSKTADRLAQYLSSMGVKLQLTQRATPEIAVFALVS